MPREDAVEDVPDLQQHRHARVVAERARGELLVDAAARGRDAAQQRAHLLERERDLRRRRGRRRAEHLPQPLEVGRGDRLHRREDVVELHLRHDEGEGGDEVDAVGGGEAEAQRRVVHLEQLRHRLRLREVLRARVAEVLHRLRRGGGGRLVGDALETKESIVISSCGLRESQFA